MNRWFISAICFSIVFPLASICGQEKDEVERIGRAIINALQQNSVEQLREVVVGISDYTWNGGTSFSNMSRSMVSKEEYHREGERWAKSERMRIERSITWVHRYGALKKLDWRKAKLVRVSSVNVAQELMPYELEKIPLHGKGDVCFEISCSKKSFYIFASLVASTPIRMPRLAGNELLVTTLGERDRALVGSWRPGLDLEEDIKVAKLLVEDRFYMPLCSVSKAKYLHIPIPLSIRMPEKVNVEFKDEIEVTSNTGSARVEETDANSQEFSLFSSERAMLEIFQTSTYLPYLPSIKVLDYSGAKLNVKLGAPRNSFMGLKGPESFDLEPRVEGYLNVEYALSPDRFCTFIKKEKADSCSVFDGSGRHHAVQLYYCDGFLFKVKVKDKIIEPGN